MSTPITLNSPALQLFGTKYATYAQQIVSAVNASPYLQGLFNAFENRTLADGQKPVIVLSGWSADTELPVHDTQAADRLVMLISSHVSALVVVPSGIRAAVPPPHRNSASRSGGSAGAIGRRTFRLSAVKARIMMKLRRLAIAVLSLAGAWPAQAFDPGKVPEGLYYNGTDVNQQLWTPLVLARAGQLVDPLLEAQANGILALEGQGRTTVLQANTAFLYGGCRTDTRLQVVQPLIAKVPTVYVATFSGADCARVQANVLENFHLSRDRHGNNPMPTLFVSPDRPEVLPRWVYGVPGALVGKYLPVRAWSRSELGGRPEPIHGVISRSHFVTLPVLEPDGLRIARLEKRPGPTYDVDLGEAAHRSGDVVITPQLHQSTAAFLKEKLWPRYFPRLEAALAQRFGGIGERFFELGLMQGVDIDNTRAFDYVGVARIGVVTRAGPWRWVDVVWCWRSGLGHRDEALQVLRTSEDALYAPGNHYFSNRNPAVWSPHLVVSGFADFDKDKRLEVISTLTRPVGMAYDKVGPASGGSHDLWLRDSAIHAWFPPAGEGRKGAWQTVFNSAVHEERIESLRAGDVRLELFGE